MWGIDARFNRADLVRRIERFGRHRSRIAVHGLDGAMFLETVAPNLSARSLVYLDPPYFVKGTQRLYKNYYSAKDHTAIAKRVADLQSSWIVSYDNAEEIAAIYRGFHSLQYGVQYSASARYVGNEIMFFSPGFVVPPVASPATISAQDLGRLERSLRTGLH